MTRPLTHGATTLGEALPDEAGAHLAISLRRHDEEGLASLLRDQQDPASPRYHAWLTPQQYGERFGLPEAAYTRIVDWLRDAGFAVSLYPNRLFVEASGTVGQVRDLLGVQLRRATQNGRTFRSHSEDLALPVDLAPLISKIGGLDTRVRLRHRMNVTWNGQVYQVLDADDLRMLYDIPTTDTGASGLTLAVLGTQEGTQANPNADPKPPLVLPSAADVQIYLTTISHATAVYNPIVLPNPDDDFDYVGSNSEYQLDVEMQSVGAPNAQNLDLVLSPASLVFQTGAQYIVNTLSGAVAVSLSLGLCESEELEWGAINDPTGDAYLMRQAVQQGLAEGQMWFASSGDTGADDCNDDTSGTGNGFGGGNATVDFPCSLPEIVCVGGTQFAGTAPWDSNGKLTAYAQEAVCNEGPDGVAGGGGQSMLYAKPTWQLGVGPKANDGQRDVPDISLTAATNTPGVVDYDCGQGQDSCPDEGTGFPGLDITGGTSVGSPLAAGIFAHLAGQLGCRLGDVHPTLYSLGTAQQSGGAQPFHDITAGNIDWVDPKHKLISGFGASKGYDLASGWGSVDVAKLVASWPSCPSSDAGLPGSDAGMAVDAGTLAKDAGSTGIFDASALAIDSGSAGVFDAGVIAIDSGTAGIFDASPVTIDSGTAGIFDASPVAIDSGTAAVLDASAVKMDSGSAASPDAAKVSDASAIAVDAGSPSPGSSSGCGCSAAQPAPSGMVGGLMLCLLALRRRRPA